MRQLRPAMWRSRQARARRQRAEGRPDRARADCTSRRARGASVGRLPATQNATRPLTPTGSIRN